MSAIGKLIKTTKTGGIVIDEYQGYYSLMSAWENKDGDIKPNMCKMRKKNFTTGAIEEKETPLKLYLGDSEERAIEILKELLGELGAEVNEPESDVPF